MRSYSKRNFLSNFAKVALVSFRIFSMSKCCRLRSSGSWSLSMVKILGLGDFGASGTPSDDEVEVESSSFVGENAGDCGLWDLGGDGGLYSGGGELK